MTDLNEDYYTLEEFIQLVMQDLGWSREKARRQILKAMLRGELPFLVDGVEAPSTATKH